jgi:hypothetical protein
MSDEIRAILNKLFESSSNVYVVSNKRQQQEITEHQDSPIPPTKQMRIDSFAKKPVRKPNDFIHKFKFFVLVTII